MSRKRRPGLDFKHSSLGGHLWGDHAGIVSAAKVMSTSRSAYREILTLCLTTGSLLGYGESFMATLTALLPFIRFQDKAEQSRAELADAFAQTSQTYLEGVAEGMDSTEARHLVMSALCENLTLALLRRDGQHGEILTDVFAYDGPNRIPPKNSANLDFATKTMIDRNAYWEVFECKQNPAGFFDPYAGKDDTDPNRTLRWRKSQVRLALAILDLGKKFASVCVVCYRPPAHVVTNLRRLDEQMPPGIPTYNISDAWDKLPWCQLPSG